MNPGGSSVSFTSMMLGQRAVPTLLVIFAIGGAPLFAGNAHAQACPSGYTTCGVSHCSPDGETCCASAGDETKSCPAGESCVQSGSGVICGGGGPSPGASCNGYSACGQECTNALNPVCCPDGVIAPTEADCNTGSSGSGCAVTRDRRPARAGLALVFGIGLALARRRRRRASTRKGA